MIGRAPHRLKVEHVHGGAVERRRRHRVETEAITDRGRLRGAALLQVVRRQDPDRFLFGAGYGDGDAVKRQPPRGLDRGCAEIFIGGCGDPFAEPRGHRHGKVTVRHSTLRLANFTTLPHFSVSAAINLPKLAGVTTIGTPPSSSSFAFSLGSARPALIALLSLSTISVGVFFGAPMPNQAEPS